MFRMTACHKPAIKNVYSSKERVGMVYDQSELEDTIGLPLVLLFVQMHDPFTVRRCCIHAGKETSDFCFSRTSGDCLVPPLHATPFFSQTSPHFPTFHLTSFFSNPFPL